MEFLGTNGLPSPRLKDASLSEKRMREAYVQTVRIMRHMFQRCRLVHGDLSEYNLLWHDNRIYVIDVSQSVESDHPSALDFLRKDVSNVNDFFRKTGNLNVMTTRQLFDFITSSLIDNTDERCESDALDDIIRVVQEEADASSASTLEARKRKMQKDEVDEAVFMSQFLPRSLNQVAEVDVQKIAVGDVEETYAEAVAALTGNRDVVDAVVKKHQRQHSQPEDDNDAPASYHTSPVVSATGPLHETVNIDDCIQNKSRRSDGHTNVGFDEHIEEENYSSSSEEEDSNGSDGQYDEEGDDVPGREGAEQFSKKIGIDRCLLVRPTMLTMNERRRSSHPPRTQTRR
jgi:hypothetical protein